MLDENVCPKCESSNVVFTGNDIDAYDRTITYMQCRDCGIEYRITWIEIVGGIDVEGEDY